MIAPITIVNVLATSCISNANMLHTNNIIIVMTGVVAFSIWMKLTDRYKYAAIPNTTLNDTNMLRSNTFMPKADAITEIWVRLVRPFPNQTKKVAINVDPMKPIKESIIGKGYPTPFIILSLRNIKPEPVAICRVHATSASLLMFR
mmetsp:Transcript_22041/g.53964  ORF Transcript_22041/g.53964 Transcript_22041/m.53964 type:complete len:146 (-) Transcript_22041:93-530(-)